MKQVHVHNRDFVLEYELVERFVEPQWTNAVTTISDNLVGRLTGDASWLTLPPLAMKIVQLDGNSKNDLGALADAVGSDPIIADKILRIANSNFYARRRQSSNLRQAMIVLGLNATFTLALALSLVAKLRQAKLNDLQFDQYWRRALLAGIWGKLLAVEFGRHDAEDVFLASLLQDVGMLAIDRLAARTYEDLESGEVQHALVIEIERQNLQTDHRRIGAWLLEHWGLPNNIIEATTHSHEFTAIDLTPETRGFCRTVALSGQLSDLLIEHSDEAAIKQVGRLAHRHFGILPNRLVELAEAARQLAPVCEGIFDMEVFAPDELQAVTDTAREILIVPNLHAWPGSESAPHAPAYTAKQVFDFSSDRDPATGIYNRRGFESILRREFDAARTNDWPLSLISVDVDRFSDVGKTPSGEVPDDLLGNIINLLINNVRDSDDIAIANDGGFILLLPGRSREESETVAERLLAAADGQAVATTLSLGIATLDQENPFLAARDLVSAADEALYHSQRSGRNRRSTYADLRAA